jgi:hypothetical protein
MNSLTEIETAIQKLSTVEINQLAEWLQTYLKTKQSELDQNEQSEQNAWDVLESMTGTIEAPPDCSINHDHYLYRVPKSYLDNNQCYYY